MKVKNMPRWLKVLSIIAIIYLLFCSVVLFFYNQIRYDPEDGAATDFLHTSVELQEEIGEVRYVARRSAEKEVEDENGLHIVYGVETFEAKYHIQVHFRNESGEWIPYDYTILKLHEVFDNETKTW